MGIINYVSRPYSWSPEALRFAVKASRNMAHCCELLNLRTHGATYKRLYMAISNNGLDISHWSPHSRRLLRKCSRCHKGVMTKRKSLWPEEMCQRCGEVEYARRIKRWAVSYLGGKCVDCGYSKCIGALQFDHRDPSLKKFRISGSHQRSIDSIKEEVDKCDLRCANCHAERHSSQIESI